jgi:hypothetical protein
LQGKGLQLTFTVEDTGVFTPPLSANLTYRQILRPWTEQVCAENVFEHYFARLTEIPTAAKRDFWANTKGEMGASHDSKSAHHGW